MRRGVVNFMGEINRSYRLTPLADLADDLDADAQDHHNSQRELAMFAFSHETPAA